jgi:hypothetical protein
MKKATRPRKPNAKRQMPIADLEYRKGDFTISTDPALIDLDLVHGFLTNSYWAKGISRGVVARSIENSLCFGVYTEGKSDLPA